MACVELPCHLPTSFFKILKAWLLFWLVVFSLLCFCLVFLHFSCGNVHFCFLKFRMVLIMNNRPLHCHAAAVMFHLLTHAVQHRLDTKSSYRVHDTTEEASHVDILTLANNTDTNGILSYIRDYDTTFKLAGLWTIDVYFFGEEIMMILEPSAVCVFLLFCYSLTSIELRCLDLL